MYGRVVYLCSMQDGMWPAALFIAGVQFGALIAASVLVLTMIVATLVYRSRQTGSEYAGLNLPPGDLGWPFIGNALEVRSIAKA